MLKNEETLNAERGLENGGISQRSTVGLIRLGG